jgi:cation diffusion facilitator family transporter
VAGSETGTGATVTALVANIGIALAKFVAFAFTGSASMLAEGIHSVADTANQVLLLVGVRRSRRPATEKHPFGYGRERYFWAFMVAVLLFTMGAVASSLEGFEKLRHPHEVTSVRVAVVVLCVAIVFEALSLRVAIRESNEIRTGGWWAFIRHAKTPELPVLLLEDTGALVGLVFALAGVTLAAITGEPRFDAAGSLAIGILLGVLAIVLAVELRSLLLGEAASPRDIAVIREAIEQDADLEQLLEMRTQHLSPDELLVAMKVRLRGDLTFREVADVINRIEARIRDRVPKAQMIYVEPDT